MKLKATAQFVNNQGKLTPEAFASLRPSTDEFKTITTAQYQATENCQIFLPVAAAINIGRGSSAIITTTNIVTLNEGDVLTLGGSTTFSIMPL